MIEFKIKIYREDENTNDFIAQLDVDKDEIIAGHGQTPYDALHDLIDEMEYHHEYVRPD